MAGSSNILYPITAHNQSNLGEGSNMDDASYDYEGIEEEEDFGHKTTRRSRRKSK